MSEQLKLKFAATEDAKMILAWLHLNGRNGFDGSILEYPTVQYLCAYGDAGPVVYLPTQKAVVLESVARKPGLDAVTCAQALRDLVKGAELEASSRGIRELYFIGSDPDVMAMAEKHGFERIEYPVLRMKLK